MAKIAPRGKNKDNARRAKKKISILNTESVGYIDYKDVNLLKRFMSDRAKIRARRVTGNSTQQQAEVAMAIKNAREMALLPYASRVTQQRGGKRGDRGDRGDRGESRPSGRGRPEGPGDPTAGDTAGEPVGDEQLADAQVEATEVTEAVAAESATPGDGGEG